MLVVYVTFEVEGDLEGFVPWFAGLAARAAESAGCVRYDFLMDPVQARHGVIAEMWETEADREAFLVLPHHIEMVALATTEWGMGNFKSYFFPQAGEPVVAGRARSETPAAGRTEMNQLVLDRLLDRAIAQRATQAAEEAIPDAATR